MNGIAALTGATGFVGRHILDALLGAGWSVRCLVRPGGALTPHPRLQTIAGDLNVESSLAGLLEGADLVVNCAGLTKARHASDYFAVNSAGVARLAAAAVARPGPPWFIQVSSLAAREPALTPYAASKHQGEVELTRLAGRLCATILRPPAIYGPGDRDILQYFKQFKSGFAVVPKAPDARFSLLYVADLAAAVMALAGSAPSAEVRNAADGVLEIHDGHHGGYRWGDVATAAEGVFDRRITAYGISRPVMLGLAGIIGLWAGASGGVPMVSTDKVRELYHPDWVCRGNPLTQLTDWRPRTDLTGGLRKTAVWYRTEGWL